MEAKKQATKELTNLCNEWVVAYNDKLKQPYKIGVKERSQLKKVYTDYGYEKTLNAIRYYINNYESIDYIRGYPSIAAFCGFRRTLLIEAIQGRSHTQKGQYSGGLTSLPDGWD